MTTLAVVVLVLLVLVSLRKTEVKREDVDPELLGAFNYLLAHLDKTVEIGQIWYKSSFEVQVLLDGEVYRFAKHPDGYIGLTSKDPLDSLGWWHSGSYGWVFTTMEFCKSLDGKTIHLY